MATVSFWLEPDVASQTILDSLVSDAHALVGGPRVVPHITVRGSIEIETSEASALIQRLDFAPVDAVLTEVRLGSIWNMALYATAVAPLLLDLRERLDKSLDLAAEAFVPHLSFAYGLAPTEVRQKAGSKIASSLPLALRFNTLSAWATEATDENDVDNWTRIEKVEL